MALLALLGSAYCLLVPAAQLYATDEADAKVEEAKYQLARAVQFTSESLARLEAVQAIPTLSQAIYGYELAVFRDAAELAEPWRLLGDAYLETGDTQAAGTAYQQSIHISRVNHGLFSPQQLTTVYRQASLFESLGDLESATGREEYALLLQRRRRATEGEAVDPPPALFRMAEWYLKVSQPVKARILYQEGIDSIERSQGETADELIDAYMGLANSYRLERFPLQGFYEIEEPEFEWQMRSPQVLSRDLFQSAHYTAASRALRHAEQLLLANARESEEHKARLSEVRILLGDWSMLFEKWASAMEWYKSVFVLWGALPEQPNVEVSENTLARLSEWFGEPVPLHLPLPSEIGDIQAVPPEMREVGFIDVAFSLSQHGKVGRIETLDTSPKDFRDMRVRRLLRSSRYRPQINFGEAVASERVVHKHEFIYIKEREVEALRGDSGASN